MIKDIQVDQDGNLRCATCGGKRFIEKRTTRAKVIGGGAGVLTFGIAGAAAPLVTRKKLQCKSCHAYNAQGNAQPFTPKDEFVAAGVPNPAIARPSGKPPKKEYSDGETLVGVVILTVFAVGGFIWAVSAGSVGWAIFAGVLTLFFGLATFGQAAENRPKAPRPQRSTNTTGKPIARTGDPAFELKRPPPTNADRVEDK